MTLGTRTGGSRPMGIWVGGGKQRPALWRSAIAHAERRPSTWVGALSRGAASDAHTHESTGKPEPAFQSVESELLVQDRPISGACAVLALTGMLGGILVCVLG